MVPCPMQGLIHQRRVMPIMKQALYPQATTAGYYLFILVDFISTYTNFNEPNSSI